VTSWCGVPGTRLFCHKMSLEQNSLACPIREMRYFGGISFAALSVTIYTMILFLDTVLLFVKCEHCSRYCRGFRVWFVLVLFGAFLNRVGTLNENYWTPWMFYVKSLASDLGVHTECSSTHIQPGPIEEGKSRKVDFSARVPAARVCTIQCWQCMCMDELGWSWTFDCGSMGDTK